MSMHKVERRTDPNMSMHKVILKKKKKKLDSKGKRRLNFQKR